MLRHLLHLLAVLVIFSTSPLLGRSQETPESIAASSIASMSQIYSDLNNGQLPESWADFSSLMDKPIEQIMPHSAPVKRYAFVSPPISLIHPHRGELFAINRSDIFNTTFSSGFWGTKRSLTGPGRYIIYKAVNNEYVSTWVSADYVQELFRRSGRDLPERDNEPERNWVRNARYEIYIWRTIYSLTFLCAAFLIINKCKSLHTLKKNQSASANSPST